MAIDTNGAIIHKETGTGSKPMPELICMEPTPYLERWADVPFAVVDLSDTARVELCRMCDNMGVDQDQAIASALDQWFSSQEYARAEARRRQGAIQRDQESNLDRS